jgi:hypothetical protein
VSLIPTATLGAFDGTIWKSEASTSFAKKFLDNDNSSDP